MFFYFFLVITTFWILKPIKKDVFVAFYNAHELGSLDGADVEQLAKVANMIVAFVAVVVFTILARKYHRHQLTVIFSAFSVLVLGVFAVLIDGGGHGVVWSFYLFGDLFNTLMVATFFVFLNDSIKPDDAKRLYGPIVLGGVAGGAAGSTFVRALIEELGNTEWMFVCIGLTVLVAVIAVTAGKIVDHRLHGGTKPEPKAAATTKGPHPAIEGARLVLRSRYLLAIVVMVALYEIVSTILDFQFTKTVYGMLKGDDAKEQLSTVYAITNWTGLGIQLLLTSFIMDRLGMRIALLIMPAAILLNSAAYLIVPALWVGSFLNTSDNALNYSVNQSSREALWTPTSRDEKYKAKAFIDMFVQRFAKALAVGINLAMSTLIVGLGGIRWLSAFAIVLVVVWMLAARYAGARFEEMSKKST
jgi:AAA family ATP:ADP antiporter